MYCTNCGNRNHNGDCYCTNCGMSILEEKSQKVANCENQNEIGWRAILPFVFGLISFFLCWIPFVSIPLAIAGILLAITYKKKNGYKVASLILNIVGMILAIIVFFLVMLSIGIVDFVENIDYFEEQSEDNYYKEESEIFDIRGSSWYGDDGSLLELDITGSYSWYQDSVGSGDTYFLGDYAFYTGDEAIDYISEHLGEYSISREEQEKYFRSGIYELDDYYLIILNCEKVVLEGIEQEITNNQLYYYGFYNDTKKSLNLVNINSKQDAVFTLKNGNQSNQIDV